MTREQELAASLSAVRLRLRDACASAGRDPAEVTLIAVSKTRPASDVAVLRDLGVTDFGESRDQEAGPKAAEVPDVRWHFVGRLQTNKAVRVARYADVVHSVDRSALVAALGTAAARVDRRLDVLLQISLDGDPARAGAPAEQVPALAAQVASTDGLRLAGVMAVPPVDADPRVAFGVLAEVARRVQADHPGATAISAGMTADLEQAVAAGATMVRVGTALFGRRPPLLR
jgi:pyridoxal phosphate enzyme (YggS family)